MNDQRARARVLCVVRAARRIQDPADEMGREARERLPGVTGLLSETIELALAEYFETQPTDGEVDSLVQSTTSAPVCHVIMSANVCTAPLRALALAVATSNRVLVRASRRDPVITELLIRALSADADFAANSGSVEMVDTVHARAGDELHVYGSDESIAAITSELPAGVLVRAHGTGIGIAIVGENVDQRSAAAAIARDVSVFDQRGCLSPRFVFVEGDEFCVSGVFKQLDEMLGVFSFRYPRGTVDCGLQLEIAHYRATMEAIGLYWDGPSHGVGIDDAPRALILPPAARIVHVVPARNARALLAPWLRYVTAVGLDGESGLARWLKEAIPRARWSRLGWMQRPLLDGPVDGRTGPIRVSGFL